MVEIERVDLDLFRSKNLFFRDDGPVNKGAKTRQFSVFSRATSSLLGYVKWWANWRQYCFFPLNSLFNHECLRQVAQFCQEATTAHKSRLPFKKRLKDMEKAKRQRRMDKLALTKAQKAGNVVNEPVPEQQNQVVEGVEPLTPLEVQLGTIPF